jgi:hypothetical protein
LIVFFYSLVGRKQDKRLDYDHLTTQKNALFRPKADVTPQTPEEKTERRGGFDIRMIYLV